MAKRKLEVELTGSNRGASRAMNAVGNDAGKLSSKLAGIGKSIAKSMAVVGVAGAVAVGSALVSAHGAAVESQKIARETERVVRTTGAAANVSADQVGDYAGKLSALTGVDDELIQSNANLLLTFTKVRNEVGKGNDIWDQGVAIALDMATVMGQDMQSATLMVGKALNNPLKGITALTRAGVSFTDQQKAQIAAMVEAGDTLGAQKVILAEMQVQFGGAAEAAATPLDRLKVTVGNLEEEVGALLIPTVDKAATWLGEKLPQGMEWARAKAAELTPTVERARDVLGDVGNRVVPVVVDVFGDLRGAGKNLWDVLSGLTSDIGPLAQGFGKLTGAGVLAGLRGISTALESSTGWLAKNSEAVRYLTAAVVVLATLGAWAALVSALETLYIHWLYFSAAVGKTTVVAGLKLILAGMGNVAAGALTMGQAGAGGLAMIRAGIAQVLSALGPLLIAVVGVGAIWQGWNKANEKASELVDTLVKVDDALDVKGMEASLRRVTAALDAQMEEWHEYDGIGGVVRGAVELLSPLENKVLDNARAVDKLRGEQERLAGSMARIEERSSTLATNLGMSRDQVLSWMRSLELDPETMGYGEMEDAIVKAATAASASTPQTDALGESYGVLADQTSSATDQLSAYKEAVDAIFGVTMSAFEAQTNYGSALQDLNNTLFANGRTLDSNTEAGRANRDALQGAADAALGWAEALAAEGDLQGASTMLAMLREQIVGVAENMFGSRDAAVAFVDSIGLTESNLADLAAGINDPSTQLAGLQDQLDVLGGTVAAPGVDVDTTSAYGTMQGFSAAFSAWITKEYPAVEARMETSTAEGRLEILDVLMREYANSNPMARAWLDTQPARVQQSALAAWVTRWQRTHPVATASIYINESSAAAAQRRLNQFAAQRPTIYADLRIVGTDIGRVVGAGAAVRRWGGIHETARWGRLPAHVTQDPTILYGERATGGEAMIPRLGNFARSVAILRQAAGWYGMDVVAQGQKLAGVGLGAGLMKSMSNDKAVTIAPRAPAPTLGGGDTYHLHVHYDGAVLGTDVDRVADDIQSALLRKQRRSARPILPGVS